MDTVFPTSTDDDARQQATMVRQAALVEELKAKFDVPDAEIAVWLGAHKTSISNLRRLERPLTMRQELRLYDFLGYAWARTTILKMCPEDLAHILTVKDNLRSRKHRKR